MIDSYSFGEMLIDGILYEKDLMILPDATVIHPWWRKTGHELTVSDIKPLLEASPDILVIGTGSPGMMQPNSELFADLQSMDIHVTILSTDRAVEEYNFLHRQGNKVSACFHLTC